MQQKNICINNKFHFVLASSEKTARTLVQTKRHYAYSFANVCTGSIEVII